MAHKGSYKSMYKGRASGSTKPPKSPKPVRAKGGSAGKSRPKNVR